MNIVLIQDWQNRVKLNRGGGRTNERTDGRRVVHHVVIKSRFILSMCKRTYLGLQSRIFIFYPSTKNFKKYVSWLTKPYLRLPCVYFLQIMKKITWKFINNLFYIILLFLKLLHHHHLWSQVPNVSNLRQHYIRQDV